MDETLAHLEALRTREPRVAMATLVGTRGTTPKKEGAKMWVGDGGRILGSVTIGGCVDARVVAEAEAVLRDGGARLLSMTLGDEDAWEMGLTCGGTVDVLIERIELRTDDDAVTAYELVARELARGQPVVIASLLTGGARLVIHESGGTALTLGDPELDQAVRAQGMVLLRSGKGSRVAPVSTPGRRMDVFFEVHAPPLTLVIVGATHLAISVAALARDLGLRTIVVDPRERFATRERFPQADELRVGMASEIVASLPLGPTTLVVLLAHDYKIELPVLRVVLRSAAAYIGVLGSRRRGAALRDLLGSDLTPDDMARIHVPIGLDIGAHSTPEIALSILAEAIAVVRGRPGGALRGIG